MVKGMLQGIPPSRPLFLPIVFSLGARVENMPIHAFLRNPTKISNALRQIRGHLRSDGVACYFDPCLEAEALGVAVEWQTENQPLKIRWPQSAEPSRLPQGLCSPEEAVKAVRVGVAIEVIRRLKSLLRDEPLLMAGVTGPFTLAARLTQLEQKDGLRREDLPDAALELAAAVMREVAAALVDAGANVIFIQEDVLPALSAESCGAWASWLEPAFNIIRFYEALPVLLLTRSRSFAENSNVILRQRWDCIVCPPLEGFSSRPTGDTRPLGSATVGIALPAKAFEVNESGGEDLVKFLYHWISDLQPAILTTAGDVPASTDMKRMNRVLENAVQTISLRRETHEQPEDNPADPPARI